MSFWPAGADDDAGEGRIGDARPPTARALRDRSVLPDADEAKLADLLSRLSFERPMPADAALGLLAQGFERFQVHTRHPRYFGLMHPAPSEVAVAAAMLAAHHNPQLATRSHAPFAVDLEAHLVRAFGERFGFAGDATEGTLTTGGAEANATALFLALAHAFPSWAKAGVRAFAREPKVYVSAEAHPTIGRAVRLAGLGDDAVRVVPVDKAHRMKVPALREALARDKARGACPLMIVATAGTTGFGAFDALGELADVAQKASAWMHVDAAWGGLLALAPRAESPLSALARADSVTFDPHKVLPVPLGCGMLVTRHPGSLTFAFHARAGYMPRKASRDPYTRSLGWSRRFAGAPLAAVMATLGWSGIGELVDAKLSMGRYLKARLTGAGWSLVNDTPLPVACFVDSTSPGGDRGNFLGAVARRVLQSGEAWVSVTRAKNGARALRASVTNAATEAEDVDKLVATLDDARRAVRASEGGGEP